MQAGNIELGEALVRAGPGDARRIGDITAEAFRNDPFNLWLFGKFAGIRNLFHLQARRIYVPRGYSYSLGDEGGCMWMLPGGEASFSLRDYAAFALPTLFRCGPGAVARGIRTGDAMAQCHPAFDHAYLFSIGLRPAAQQGSIRMLFNWQIRNHGQRGTGRLGCSLCGFDLGLAGLDVR